MAMMRNICIHRKILPSMVMMMLSLCHQPAQAFFHSTARRNAFKRTRIETLRLSKSARVATAAAVRLFASSSSSPFTFAALKLTIPTPEDMEDLGALLSQISNFPGDTLLLDGDLGAGKTCLSRGFVQTLVGGDQRVTSPTYLLCNSYDIASVREDNAGTDVQSPKM